MRLCKLAERVCVLSGWRGRRKRRNTNTASKDESSHKGQRTQRSSTQRADSLLSTPSLEATYYPGEQTQDYYTGEFRHAGAATPLQEERSDTVLSPSMQLHTARGHPHSPRSTKDGRQASSSYFELLASHQPVGPISIHSSTYIGSVVHHHSSAFTRRVFPICCCLLFRPLTPALIFSPQQP